MTVRISATDRLSSSYLLLIGILLFSIFCLLALVLDCGLRNNQSETQGTAMIHALNLSNLALVPSGRPQRAPEFLNPAVDLRPSPLLLPADPGPAELILPTLSGFCALDQQ